MLPRPRRVADPVRPRDLVWSATHLCSAHRKGKQRATSHPVRQRTTWPRSRQNRRQLRFRGLRRASGHNLRWRRSRRAVNADLLLRLKGCDEGHHIHHPCGTRRLRHHWPWARASSPFPQSLAEVTAKVSCGPPALAPGAAPATVAPAQVSGHCVARRGVALRAHRMSARMPAPMATMRAATPRTMPVLALRAVCSWAIVRA